MEVRLIRQKIRYRSYCNVINYILIDKPFSYMKAYSRVFITDIQNSLSITLIFTNTLGYAVIQNGHPYSQVSYNLQNKAKMTECKVRPDQGQEVNLSFLAVSFQTNP